MKIWQILMVSVSAGVALPALAQMAEKSVTRAEVEAQVRERLNRFDANKDGIVSRDEIATFTKARMESRADDTFAAMDTDKNGSISRAEYDAYSAKRGERRIVHMERIGGPDGMITADGKGIVIVDAVKLALDRFDAADTNKDGTLSPEERKARRGGWRAKVS